MPDVYRIVDGTDPRQVIGDVPPFEMDVEKGDLTSVLQHISGNDTARSIVGGSSTRLNQLLLDHGALVSLEGRADGSDDFDPDTTETRWSTRSPRPRRSGATSRTSSSRGGSRTARRRPRPGNGRPSCSPSRST